MSDRLSDNQIYAYWQPGCTSCLRMKEFLTKRGVPFVSVNVLADPEGLADLEKLGLRSVPITRRNKEWADGQNLKEVARIANIPYQQPQILPPAELYAKLDAIQAAAQRFFGQIPANEIATTLPASPRTYGQLAYHIFSIAESFLEHEEDGIRLEASAHERVPPPGATKESIQDYGRAVQKRLHAWWEGHGNSANYSAKANVYYANCTLHEFLERTTWHCGQHVRQMMMVLGMLKLQPDRPVGDELWKGLPMPEQAWG